MELPSRAVGDQLLPPGELEGIRKRLRVLAERHDLTSVIACAFDHRTRMLPFFFADLRMAPAGARAIGSALLDSGFAKSRIVLQQWNRNFQPSRATLDGRLPDLLLISSMSLHTVACRAMLRDICRVEPDKRPLVIAGGSLCIYEPWEVFSAGDAAGAHAAADLAVTGEEYVLLSVLETLLAGRAGNEPIRRTFLRARREGALAGIPSLVYAQGDDGARPAALVNTGVQRLAGNLDELPPVTLGYSILEPPSRRATLGPRPLEPDQVAKHSSISSMVMTFGCKFSCEYCPIPAYNQRNLRSKSGERIRDEYVQLNRQYGLKYFFGTDDNFFANKDRALEVMEALASAEVDGKPLGRRVRWGTEVTVHDTLAMREHLPLAHRAGVRALWLGVEDMTGALVKKGQTTGQTQQVFQLLRQRSICPMPMMMHHETQPLISRSSAKGLLNQVRILRRSGAVSLQVLMLTPSAGSRSYERTFESGMVLGAAGSRRVGPQMYDGNYVIASAHPRPWRKQFNIMLAYLYFYNPMRMLGDLFAAAFAKGSIRGRVGFKPMLMQIVGMFGLCYTVRRTLGWAFRLMFCRIHRHAAAPTSQYPMNPPKE